MQFELFGGVDSFILIILIITDKQGGLYSHSSHIISHQHSLIINVNDQHDQTQQSASIKAAVVRASRHEYLESVIDPLHAPVSMQNLYKVMIMRADAACCIVNRTGLAS